MERFDLEIVQGSSFAWLILVRDVNKAPLDMSTYTTGTAGIRTSIKTRNSNATDVAVFQTLIADDSAIIAAEQAGLIKLTTTQLSSLLSATDYGSCYVLAFLTASDTAAISSGKYVYQIEVEDAQGFVFKPYYGNVSVSSEGPR